MNRDAIEDGFTTEHPGYVQDRSTTEPQPDGFARYAMPVLSTTPGRVAVAPGLEIRELAIELAVDWLKSDPTTDAHRLFTAADLIAEYIRTGAHPKPQVCATACDDDCEVGCHEAHAVPAKRHHDPDTCAGQKE